MTRANRQIQRVRISVVLFSLSLFIFGCVSKPPVVELVKNNEIIPQSKVQLTEINAKNPDELELVFELTTENKETASYRLKQIEAVLQLEGSPAGTQILEPSLLLATSSTSVQKFTFPVNLRDIPNLISDDIQYDLDLRLEFLTNEGAKRTNTISLEGSFPRVQKPLFRISSIKIHRDELINTSMNISLEIENLNGFPLELSALTYEIFGEGRYWADGRQDASFQIPAHSKVIVISEIIMNFIDMKRSLLDQFIKMQNVEYHIKGTVRVLTSIQYLPAFSMKFDEQGRTPVIE